MPKDVQDPERSAVKMIYDVFSVWGEISDINIKSGPSGYQPFITYAHRFYAEFAREAMLD